MLQIQDQLMAMFEPVVSGLGYELAGLEYRPNPNYGLLRIYIDKEGGITVDDCAIVSRQISGILDVEDPIPGHYNLEVSSLGINRPLFKLADYQKFAGNEAKIQLDRLYEGRRKFHCVILGIDEGSNMVKLEEKDEKFEVPFERISKARLIQEV
ncbi:MAG: ribosome maturation factor RimP [Gammaproteobacteria bacterium]|nr:MAG: ribosome maturation factor RimP [Gammaproteobacteria bacterium]